ncbi:unnamed protein product [Acanthoscelides obtectus]|uniref:Uncharacterized protein n=1 Tax=Acanthoscelides obtectus TaxID=200917 RepID=A0A9P0Q3E3_ACAOB|nr:unnamed protein product [Acanthoscelides obtectus]CAK1680480.1 hypothetical protein AOBTE_LOCUS32689 [Acanthoscelides obtectus]
MNNKRSAKILEMVLCKKVNEHLGGKVDINVNQSITDPKEININRTDESTPMVDCHFTIDSTNFEHPDMNMNKICLTIDAPATVSSDMDWQTKHGKQSKKDELAIEIDLRYVNCPDLEYPPYLLPAETSISKNDHVTLASVNQLNDFFRPSVPGIAEEKSKKHVLEVPMTSISQLIKLSEPSTSYAANKIDRLPTSHLLDDLEISSSESDPFGGDDDDKDPDFQLSDNNKNKCRNLIGNNNLPIKNSSSEGSDTEEEQQNNSRKRIRRLEKK